MLPIESAVVFGWTTEAKLNNWHGLCPTFASCFRELAVIIITISQVRRAI